MKKRLLGALTAVMLMFGAGNSFAQTTGGPDSYGYRWANSQATGGPTYNWIEIAQTGTEVTGLGDDNFVGPFSMPTFSFYWNNFNSFTIGSNGYIRLGDQGLLIASGQTGFTAFPDANGNSGKNVIGAFLSDLTFLNANGTPVPTAKCYYQVVGSKLVVQYDNVPYWNANGGTNQISGSNTFQIQLDAADSTITFQYKSILAGRYIGYADFNQAGINGPILNTPPANRIGLNAASRLVNRSNFAIRFRPPANTTYNYTDASLQWIHNPDDLGITMFKGQPANLRANIKNSGTQNHTNTINARLIVLDDQSNVVLQDNVQFGGPLAKGKDTTIIFPASLPTNLAPGNYLAQVTTTMNGDQLVENNEAVAKFALLDSNSSGEIVNTFLTKDTIQYTVIGGSAGNIFSMPFYPAQVVGIEVMTRWPDKAFYQNLGQINSDDSLVPLDVSVYSGQVLPTAATLLTSFSLTQPVTDATNGIVADTIAGSRVPQGLSEHYVLMRKTLATPINLTAGDLYVGVSANRTTRFIWNGLVVDTLVPTSGRAHEITAGVWSPSRSRAELELGIGLVLKAQGTVTSGPRAEQYVVVGNLYPNPAKERAYMPLNLKGSSAVSMKLVNANGQVVSDRNLGYYEAGKHNVSLDLNEVASGMYFCQISTAEGVSTKRLVVK